MYFPVWLRNLLISAGLKPVLSLTEKSCTASYYRQFSTNIINYKINTSFFLSESSAPWGNKTGFIPITYRFKIRGKLSIVRCDK